MFINIPEMQLISQPSPNRILHRASLFNYDIDLRVWAVEIWDLWLF